MAVFDPQQLAALQARMQATQNLAPPPGPPPPNMPGPSGMQQVAAMPPPPQPNVEPPMATVEVPQPKPGPIKSLLTNLLYGGGQAMLQHVGLPTDYEKQQNALKIQLQQQQQQSLEQYRQAEGNRFDAIAAAQNAQNAMVPTPEGIPGLAPGVMVRAADLPKLLAGGVANQGKTDVAHINLGMPVKVSPDYAQSIGMPELANQTVSGKTMSNLNKLAQGLGLNHTVGDIGGGHTGIIDKTTGKIIQDFGTSQRIIGANINAANRTVQVIDPRNPANTVQVAPAVANRMGAMGTQSTDFQAGRTLQKDFTSGVDAHTLNAINTARGHLGQLAEVSDALKNGNVQILNRIANQYGVQTGQPAPVMFQAIRTALTGELGKAFSGGAATVAEQAELAKALNDAQSPEQLKQFANTNIHLMDTKKQSLQQQYTQGRSGQPNFGANGTPAPEGTVARMKDGSMVVKRGGQWVKQ